VGRIVFVISAVVVIAASTGSGSGTTAAAADPPRVGGDLGSVVQTCERWRGASTPTAAGDCLVWGGDAPVNVVVTVRGQGALDQLARAWAPVWRPAQGRWLVARGRVSAECGTGSVASTLQLEQRLDAVSRHHVKFVQATCGDATTVAFGSAHTDHFERHRCGGDHAVGLDAARDAFVRAVLLSTPGARVSYRADHPATVGYDGGCGSRLTSDGRVAYITLGGAAGPTAPHTA
jgi:hypothetical protein